MLRSFPLSAANIITQKHNDIDNIIVTGFVSQKENFLVVAKLVKIRMNVNFNANRGIYFISRNIMHWFKSIK